MVLKNKSNSIHAESSILQIMAWIFGTTLLTIGLLNIFLVHPLPGIIYLLLSFLYFPPVTNLVMKRFGFCVPLVIKIILAIIIIMFTLGVSDLGDMIE